MTIGHMAERFVPLSLDSTKQAFSQVAGNDASQNVTINARCTLVGIRATDDARVRFDGTAPTSTVGWHVGTVYQWFELEPGGGTLKVFAATGVTVDVLQVYAAGV